MLKGYLAVDSDAGPDYGKFTLLTLPEQTTTPGPGQVQSQFKTDNSVSTFVNLLTTGGNTKVEYGNLLTLPVGGGLLYVQPVYVRATGETSYPLLRKMLVAFGSKVAFEDTLDEALNSLFGSSGVTVPDSDAGGGAPDTGGGTTTPGTGSGTTTDNAALTKALADASQALQNRTAAYAKNDLVAAATADKALQDAIAAAIAAESTSTSTSTSTPTPTPTPTK